MIFGIFALCEPWSLFLHRFGATVTLIGLIALRITSSRAEGRRCCGQDGEPYPDRAARGAETVRPAAGHQGHEPGRRRSQFIVMLGQSGCKTTMLRAIAGPETIDEGDILIDGKGGAAPEGRRPRHRLRLPVLLLYLDTATAASPRTSRSSRATRMGRGEADAAVRRVAEVLRIARCSPSGRRSRAATCRQRHRWAGRSPPPEGAPTRRADRLARRQAPRGDARRDEAPALAQRSTSIYVTTTRSRRCARRPHRGDARGALAAGPHPGRRLRPSPPTSSSPSSSAPR